METIEKIKELVESMIIDTNKVYRNGNKTASIRARKNAQEVKKLLHIFRQEILNEIKIRKDE